MINHDYQYDINALLTKDSTGLVSSFVLQLDNILAEDGVTPATQRLVDETMQFLHSLVGGKLESELEYDFNNGYSEGYCDAEERIPSRY